MTESDSARPRVDGEGDPLGRQALTSLLQDLVRIESVNPGVYEHAMGERVTELLEPTGADLTAVEMFDGRHSIAAVVGDSSNGPTLVLNGHMDTVPVEDEDEWTVDPFAGVIKDGAVYGRGACDMKAGLAIQIAVARALATRVDEMKGVLILHFAAGEECAEPGTNCLLDRGFAGDYGIVTEPTELEVAVAERGLAHYTVRIHGKSAHASRPDLGINPAIYLPAVIQMVEDYRLSIQDRDHALLDSASCTPTVIRGGAKANTIPSHCDVVLDRRLLPGETIDGELESLRERAARLEAENPGLRLEVRRPQFGFEPAEIAPGSPLPRRLTQLVGAERADAHDGVVGTPFASDVSALVNEGGMEAVTFGPGSISNCHCADEHVAIDEVMTAARVISQVAEELLLDDAQTWGL